LTRVTKLPRELLQKFLRKQRLIVERTLDFREQILAKFLA